MSPKSNCKAPFLSRHSHFLPSRFRKNLVYVLGLLGTTDLKPGDDDLWMATEFVAIRHLLGAHDDLSQWLCGASIREGKFLLGDPACDRIVFDPPPFETLVLNTSALFMTYSLEVHAASLRLCPGDTLVLVLVGHGSKENGSFLVGDSKVYRECRKEELEVCVRNTKGSIVLISTACYSGSWTSPHWTLIATAGASQEAPSLVMSGSDQHRGGFFANAVLAEFANEFSIKAPCPASVDNNGRGTQLEHDFGPEKSVTPVLRFPRPSMQGIIDWIHQFRDDIARTYTTADLTFSPCGSGEPHSLPFTSLITSREPFHRLACVPPLHIDQSSLHSTTSCVKHNGTTPSSQYSSMEMPEELSASEEAELRELAANHLHFMPVSTASEIPMIRRCLTILYGARNGRRLLDDAEKSKLLSQLKNRVRYREFALAIALNLGWEKAVEELGGPTGKQQQMCNVYDLQTQAEESGCLARFLVIYETPIHLWGSAASWLARVWEAAGRPIVSPEDWERAVKQYSPDFGQPISKEGSRLGAVETHIYLGI
jgi:hypothetical protein